MAKIMIVGGYLRAPYDIVKNIEGIVSSSPDLKMTENKITCRTKMNWISKTDLFKDLNGIAMYTDRKLRGCLYAVEPNANPIEITLSKSGPKTREASWRFKHVYR